MTLNFLRDEHPHAELADKLTRAKAYPARYEVAAAGDIHIEGHAEPLRIEILVIKDVATGLFRKFSMEIKAPKGMKARLTRAMDPKKPDLIVLP
jgi:hypothetical protein